MYSNVNGLVYNIGVYFLLILRWALVQTGGFFNIDIEYYLAKSVWTYQYVYTRYGKPLRDFVNENTSEIIKYPYIAVKDGDHVKLCFKPENTSDYDMILHETLDLSHRKIVVRLIDGNVLDNNAVDQDDNFELSSVHLLGIKLYISNKEEDLVREYEIDFGNNNFYIVGNTIFDRVFIAYWLQRFYDITMLPDDTYKLTFFDNNINECNLEEPNSITFFKDTYAIHRHDEDVTNDEIS